MTTAQRDPYIFAFISLLAQRNKAKNVQQIIGAYRVASLRCSKSRALLNSLLSAAQTVLAPFTAFPVLLGCVI